MLSARTLPTPCVMDEPMIYRATGTFHVHASCDAGSGSAFLILRDINLELERFTAAYSPTNICRVEIQHSSLLRARNVGTH
jgi:hypothetical protein